VLKNQKVPYVFEIFLCLGRRGRWVCGSQRGIQHATENIPTAKKSNQSDQLQLSRFIHEFSQVCLLFYSVHRD
jgi:hypothetical protein